MKRITCTILFFLALVSGQAQEAFVPNKQAGVVKAPTHTLNQGKCSPFSKFLLGDYEQLSAAGERNIAEVLEAKYQLTLRGQELVAGAFLKLNNRFDDKKWVSQGVSIRSYPNDLATTMVPVRLLRQLVNDPGVDYLQVGEPLHQKLDAAKIDAGVDLIHQGFQLPQPFKGNGVVVGVMDSGFDLTHPNWYSEDQQSYRLVSMWDQNTSVGNPPPGYSYGTHIEGASNLLNWENDNFLDNGSWISQGSHGTHVAGIAGGSGLGTGTTLQGVAPSSNMVFVSYNGTDQGFADGVAYVYEVAQALGMPCVINMSLGKHTGPHDGQSFFDQFLDGLSAPGRIAVGAAGNEGDTKLHLRKNFNAADSILYTFVEFKNPQLPTNGSGIFDIWGDVGTEFTVAVNLYHVNGQYFIDWTDYISVTTDGQYEWELYDEDGDPVQVVIAAQRNNPLNGKGNIGVAVNSSSQDDGDVYVMIEVIAQNGTIDMWTDDGSFSDLGFNAPVVDGDVQFTVGELGGTGNSVVTVGAHTTKNNYINLAGQNMGIDFPAPLGEIAPFSSIGPTADGRLKPEVSASGNVVVSSFSSYDPDLPGNHPLVVDGVSDGNRTWYYGAFQGTSMATPVVAGSIALWLQADPNLEHDDILDIIAETSWEDNYTGNIPVNGSTVWGYGKLDAYAGLLAVLGGSTSVQELDDISATVDVVPNPAWGEVILGAAIKKDALMTIHTLTGQQVMSKDLPYSGPYTMTTFNVSDLEEGMYIITISNEREFGNHKLVVSR